MFATFNNNIRIDGSKSVAKMRHHNVFAVKRIDRKKNTSNPTSNRNKLNRDARKSVKNNLTI